MPDDQRITKDIHKGSHDWQHVVGIQRGLRKRAKNGEVDLAARVKSGMMLGQLDLSQQGVWPSFSTCQGGLALACGLGVHGINRG
jgi:hypothetical protein